MLEAHQEMKKIYLHFSPHLKITGKFHPTRHSHCSLQKQTGRSVWSTPPDLQKLASYTYNVLTFSVCCFFFMGTLCTVMLPIPKRWHDLCNWLLEPHLLFSSSWGFYTTPNRCLRVLISGMSFCKYVVPKKGFKNTSNLLLRREGPLKASSGIVKLLRLGMTV